MESSQKTIKRPLNWPRTLRKGDSRPKDDVQDGRVFLGYQLRREISSVYERWIKPESLQKERRKRFSIQHNFVRPKDWRFTLRKGQERPNTKEYANLQDGKVFHSYKRNGLATYEVWLSPERFEELEAKTSNKPAMRQKEYRAHEKQPSALHLLIGLKYPHPQIIAKKQLLIEAKDLVAKAIQQGLITKK